jgi:hypothetical protein
MSGQVGVARRAQHFGHFGLRFPEVRIVDHHLSFEEHRQEFRQVANDPGVRRAGRGCPDHLTGDVYPKEQLPKYREMLRLPNRVAFASFIENPRDDPRHSLDVLGGAQAEIVTGKSTEFQRFGVDGRTVYGAVVTQEERKPVPSGKVVLRIASGREPKAKLEYMVVRLKGGQFQASLKQQGERVKAFYIPSPGYGDSESEEKKIG